MLWQMRETCATCKIGSSCRRGGTSNEVVSSYRPSSPDQVISKCRLVVPQAFMSFRIPPFWRS